MITPHTIVLARKLRASSYFVSAAAFLLAAFLTPFKLPIGQAVCAGCLLLILARWLQMEGIHALAAAAKAPGAPDDTVAPLLKTLGRGWKVWRNYQASGIKGADVTDGIDFVIAAKNGRTFVLSARAHMGTVILDQGRMARQVGMETLPFEQNLVETSNQHRRLVEQKTGKRGITPVIVFTRASLKLHSRCVDGVYAITLPELIPFLKWASKAELRHGAQSGAQALTR